VREFESGSDQRLVTAKSTMFGSNGTGAEERGLAHMMQHPDADRLPADGLLGDQRQEKVQRRFIE
jgi:hypothetical protein